MHSLSGLSSTGFICTEGFAKQARACSAWARPISPPSSVTAALFDMFCGLNGRAGALDAPLDHDAARRRVDAVIGAVPFLAHVDDAALEGAADEEALRARIGIDVGAHVGGRRRLD